MAGGVAFPSQELFEKAKSAMRKLDDADPEHAGYLAAYFSKLTTAFGWLSGHWSTARTEIDEVKQWCEPAVVSGKLKHSAQELVSVLKQHLGSGKEKEGGGRGSAATTTTTRRSRPRRRLEQREFATHVTGLKTAVAAVEVPAEQNCPSVKLLKETREARGSCAPPAPLPPSRPPPARGGASPALLTPPLRLRRRRRSSMTTSSSTTTSASARRRRRS